FRVASSFKDIDIIRINDPGADAHTLAHLLCFDSIHGQWDRHVVGEAEHLVVDGSTTICTRNTAVSDTDWSDCDVVIEASGTMRTSDKLQGFLDQGVKRVVVTAPVKEAGVLNVVMGVNHDAYDAGKHRIVTAASCTTNSLAPVIKVLHEHIGIEQGSITTIHNLTNTQTILDASHKDLRRARACGMSLIPTTTGSATAITKIFPELTGRLNGHAVRVPITNASLTDFVFDASRNTSVEEINQLLKEAADNELSGILGFEERPLVSIDFKSDPRSSIVDALSTMVVNHTHVKIYAWYDNEYGYANRTVELAALVGRADQS
ncbi:MAG: ArsJ-associated glyceraldehyde-3-phosphate dehydrogenase, partial [Granulosicoccus sp.]